MTTKYKAKLSRQDNGELEITCSNTLNKKETNNGDCKRSLCECDKAFAESFAENFNQWDESNWKLEEKGQYDDKCKKVTFFSTSLTTGRLQRKLGTSCQITIST